MDGAQKTIKSVWNASAFMPSNSSVKSSAFDPTRIAIEEPSVKWKIIPSLPCTPSHLVSSPNSTDFMVLPSALFSSSILNSGLGGPMNLGNNSFIVSSLSRHAFESADSEFSIHLFNSSRDFAISIKSLWNVSNAGNDPNSEGTPWISLRSLEHFFNGLWIIGIRSCGKSSFRLFRVFVWSVREIFSRSARRINASLSRPSIIRRYSSKWALS